MVSAAVTLASRSLAFPLRLTCSDPGNDNRKRAPRTDSTGTATPASAGVSRLLAASPMPLAAEPAGTIDHVFDGPDRRRAVGRPRFVSCPVPRGVGLLTAAARSSQEEA